MHIPNISSAISVARRASPIITGTMGWFCP